MSASGKIQAERTVNVSSDTVGRVVNLAVNEGDRVTKGQFLLQIDPKTLRSRVDNEQASVKARRSRSSRCGRRWRPARRSWSWRART